jgi:hypothetical protein
MEWCNAALGLAGPGGYHFTFDNNGGSSGNAMEMPKPSQTDQEN